MVRVENSEAKDLSAFITFITILIIYIFVLAINTKLSAGTEIGMLQNATFIVSHRF